MAAETKKRKSASSTNRSRYACPSLDDGNEGCPRQDACACFARCLYAPLCYSGVGASLFATGLVLASGEPSQGRGQPPAVPDGERVSPVQMFNILEQMQKPKAPVVPMAVRLACLSRIPRAPSHPGKRCMLGPKCHLRTISVQTVLRCRDMRSFSATVNVREVLAGSVRGRFSDRTRAPADPHLRIQHDRGWHPCCQRHVPVQRQLCIVHVAGAE